MTDMSITTVSAPAGFLEFAMKELGYTTTQDMMLALVQQALEQERQLYVLEGPGEGELEVMDLATLQEEQQKAFDIISAHTGLALLADPEFRAMARR
ncbi:hypothetical protein [Nocardia arthritidis]|uniref:hypothetical protein n=1 Tax=Nocardia arthritidis TaxID=228602 RepID=UPI00142DD5EC|nr:hypothetical protein [Nocardia arthritidis]